MVGKGQIEQDEIRQADRILADLPQNESTVVARTDGTIGIIRAHLNLGETDAALDRLKQLNLSPVTLESRLVARRLHQVRGDIEFKLSHFKEAQEAYLAAVAIAESGLSTLRDDHDRLRWSQENGPSYRALANALIRQGDPGAALEVWEQYRAAPIRRASTLVEPVAQRNGDAHLTLASFNNSGIVRKIQPGLSSEMLIVYAFLPDGLGVWSLDDSGIDFQFAQLNAHKIQQLARQFTDKCSTPQSDLTALRKDGVDLYNALIHASSSRLKSSRTLVFETDGELDNVPFAALVDGSGKYLVETYPILFSPGLAYRDYLRKPAPIHRTDRALIVGDPAISPKWRRILPPLPSARTEAEAIAERFENPIVLIGPKASRSEVEQALASAQVFQFAGHSLQTGSGTALLVTAESNASNDPSLVTFTTASGRELQQLQIAILSACHTGKNYATSTGTVARPFLLAGVPQIVLTNWDIDSAASTEFVNGMYEQLFSDKLSPDALRHTATMMLRRPGWGHPYYWAAFSLVGRT
jgi:CHAT domain-containing protein